MVLDVFLYLWYKTILLSRNGTLKKFAKVSLNEVGTYDLLKCSSLLRLCLINRSVTDYKMSTKS